MRYFLTFVRKFAGRYAKLTRLDVAGRQLVRREVAIGGLVVIWALSVWPQSPVRRAMMNAGASPNQAKAHLELAKEAAKVYDYELAEEEYKRAQVISTQVLGARDEVFPEEVIKAEIGKWEKTAETINTRGVWLKLAGLYWQVFDEEKARESWQKAWLVDTNNKEVISVLGLVGP